MIRLGLRLAVAGGREAISRLALITLAVAVGCALLLATLATSNAFTAQNDRYAWLETGFHGSSSDSPAAHDPAWWLLQADYFQGKLIGRVDVAATGPNPPVPPGIAALPAAGELYVSPALADLLRTTPADELRARYPGTQIGIIGADALPSPDSLLVIIGRSVADLSRAATGAELMTEISTTSPGECVEVCAPGVGTDANGIVLVLSVVAAALLFPVLVFVGGATRLSAARREQRFAAMRLVGATPRQVSRLATIESTVATAIGAAIGFGLFAVLRPAVADLPFSGTRFFTSDLSLTTANVLLVAVGVPVAAAFAARVALRRVNISPLGVTRRVTPRPPRPVRLIPLAAGVMWLAYLAFVSDIRHSVSSYTQAYAYLAGVFAMMIGLVVAGPWLTMLGARLSARRATRAGGLIAARRLSDNPRAAFRAVSGVVLAVFVGTCAIGIITTITAYNAGAAGDTANATGTLVMPFFRVQDRPSDQSTSVAPDVRHDLMAIAGVEGVAAVHVDRGVRFRFLASCAEIARLPALGRCTPGAETAQIELDLGGAVIDEGEPMSARTWPDARVSTDQLSTMLVDTIVVGTDGSRDAIERARTLLEASYPQASPYAPMTLSESSARSSKQLHDYQRLADVVVLTSLPIAGCSLAVSVAGGLAERRRPFSLLRLSGVPMAMLRRVVTLETAVPLLLSVVVSAVAGFGAAALFLRAQLDQTLQPPGALYYAFLVAGVGASLAIVASTMPMLARVTGPETARSE